eukprot:XP_025981176.1 bidirectional sugar transporter NEC1 [Glycine max]
MTVAGAAGEKCFLPLTILKGSNFYTIYKKKSSEGFQSIPYVVALLSALLLLYYDFIKTKATLIITINCIGCVIEVLYLTMYIIYAPRKQKVKPTWKSFLLNPFTFCSMLSTVFMLLDGVAPFLTLQLFMPFSLSLFLTLCAIMWFLYGFFDKDDFIMVRNIISISISHSTNLLKNVPLCLREQQTLQC